MVRNVKLTFIGHSRSNCSAFYLYRATRVGFSRSPSLCVCVGIEGCRSCMALFVTCTSILTNTLIPSTCAAHGVRSVYAVGINMILLTVFPMFVDFFECRYALRQGHSVSKDVGIPGVGYKENGRRT